MSAVPSWLGSNTAALSLLTRPRWSRDPHSLKNGGRRDRCRLLAERRQELAAAPNRLGGPRAGCAFVGRPRLIPAKTDQPSEPSHNPAQPAQLHGSTDPEGETAYSDRGRGNELRPPRAQPGFEPLRAVG